MFELRVASHDFIIHNRYSYIEKLCKDYVIFDALNPHEIYLTDEEIEYENKDNGNWSLEYLESLAIYRKICEFLIDDNIVLFHSSALMIHDKAYLFTAPSGTGKSTHARLWREYFGSDVTMINDDKPLLKITDDEIRVYGTPYGGKDNIQTNISAKVSAIVILHQAKKNEIKRLSKKEAYPILLNQTYRSTDPKKLIHCLDLVQKLSLLPIYVLDCDKSREAVEVCSKALFMENL